jgi:hypothetical protein
VAYAISKLAHDVRRMGKGINFELIWRTQTMPEALRDSLVVASDYVRRVVENPPQGAVTNVTEWAKRESCWNRVEALEVRWPDSLETVLMGWEEMTERKKEGMKAGKALTGIKAQIAVVSAGPAVWKQVLEWSTQRKVLSQKELEILAFASKKGSLASEKQSLVIMKALEKARKEGCPFGPQHV